MNQSEIAENQKSRENACDQVTTGVDVWLVNKVARAFLVS